MKAKFLLLTKPAQVPAWAINIYGTPENIYETFHNIRSHSFISWFLGPLAS